MIYRSLADVVLILHLAFILFVIAGGLLVLRWRWAAAVHLPVALYGALIEFVGWICPLTPLENSLRRAAGDSAYASSFIEHYIVSMIYPAGLTRTLQLALAVGLVVLNAGIYALVIRRRLRERRGED